MTTPAPHPQVSVIIPIYNSSETIGDCLDALFQSEFKNFEVIIVDDGSEDESREIVSTYPCQLIEQANAGPGAARNIGARSACGEILFFLDGDILVKPDSLTRIASTFAARPELGALFGSFGAETSPENFVTVYKNLRHHYTHQTSNENAATFCTGLGAIRRDIFEWIGGFHPPVRFLEDIEIGHRLHKAGVPILLCKDLQLTHLKGYTLGGLIESDLFGRAVPWTRLVLSQRLFRNDLNTRTHNVLSVPCSLALLATLPLTAASAFLGSGAPAAGLFGALLLIFLFLNREFLVFLARTKSAGLALASVALLWLGYLYSALGVVIGVWLHYTSEAEGYGLADSRELAEVKTNMGLR
jgi:GT2 family glycosyltransferase